MTSVRGLHSLWRQAAASRCSMAAVLALAVASSPADGQPSPVQRFDTVRLPAGIFVMGCVIGDSGCEAHELPRHEVRLTTDVFMSRTETTVDAYATFGQQTGHRTRAEESGRGRDWNHAKGQWESVNGLTFRQPYADGTKADGAWPAVQVSWADADAFCRWTGGRLPSEAEWEYGARAGKAGERYPWGDEPPVGRLAPNAFGLLDMPGNAWAWVSDWYAADFYKSSPIENPKGPSTGKARVLRARSGSSRPDSRNIGAKPVASCASAS